MNTAMLEQRAHTLSSEDANRGWRKANGQELSAPPDPTTAMTPAGPFQPAFIT
jgi:hypothetical protein